MTGDELRSRIERLEITFKEAARRLGLTRAGLYKQMSGERKVSRQTEYLMHALENGWQPPKPRITRAA
jgi:hypothetical protein